MSNTARKVALNPQMSSYLLTLRDLGSRRRFVTWGGGAWHPPLWKNWTNFSIGLKFSNIVYSTTLNKYAKKKFRKSQFNPMMTPQNPRFYPILPEISANL